MSIWSDFNPLEAIMPNDGPERQGLFDVIAQRNGEFDYYVKEAANLLEIMKMATPGRTEQAERVARKSDTILGGAVALDLDAGYRAYVDDGINSLEQMLQKAGAPARTEQAKADAEIVREMAAGNSLNIGLDVDTEEIVAKVDALSDAIAADEQMTTIVDASEVDKARANLMTIFDRQSGMTAAEGEFTIAA